MASRSRCSTSACIAGSKRSRSLSWMREAFGQVARADAGGSKRLQDRQHRLDLGAAARRASRRRSSRSPAEIAGLVHHIDQILADHAAHRIGDRQRHLLGEMIGERRLGRDERFEIVVAVLARRRSRRRTIPNRPAAAARTADGLSPPSSGKTFSSSVPSPCSMALRLVSSSSPIQSGAAARRRLPLAIGRRLRARRRQRRVVVVAGALQQRIALELALDIGGQIQTRELQQLDGLHQLRRHHQRLALAELESLRQRHRGFPAETGPILACIAIPGSCA